MFNHILLDFINGHHRLYPLRITHKIMISRIFCVVYCI